MLIIAGATMVVVYIIILELRLHDMKENKVTNVNHDEHGNLRMITATPGIELHGGVTTAKETEKYVRLKGFPKTTGYLNYSATFDKFFIDNAKPDSCIKIKFTKSWLKDNWSEYEAYNNAGLLEFEEVEDDK